MKVPYRFFREGTPVCEVVAIRAQQKGLFRGLSGVYSDSQMSQPMDLGSDSDDDRPLKRAKQATAVPTELTPRALDLNIEMHAEGGWHHKEIGSDSTFVDLDTDVAAAVALAEGHVGDGVPLFNEDGSLRLPVDADIIAEAPSQPSQRRVAHSLDDVDDVFGPPEE